MKQLIFEACRDYKDVLHHGTHPSALSQHSGGRLPVSTEPLYNVESADVINIVQSALIVLRLAKMIKDEF